MCYYDFRIPFSDGSVMSFHYSFDELDKALRRANRLLNSCSIVQVVDGKDCRVVFSK